MIIHTAHTQTTFFEHLSLKISFFEKERSLAYITPVVMGESIVAKGLEPV